MCVVSWNKIEKENFNFVWKLKISEKTEEEEEEEDIAESESLWSLKMDSSPDLSLKLRRGSNGSHDSFYMDFAQGIDSDIEEVETIASGGPHTAIVTTRTPSGAGGDEGAVDELDSLRDNADNDDLDDDSPTIPIPPPPPPLKLDDR